MAIHGTQPKGAKRSAAPKQETSPEGPHEGPHRGGIASFPLDPHGGYYNVRILLTVFGQTATKFGMLTNHGLDILRGRNRNPKVFDTTKPRSMENLTSVFRLRSAHQVYAVSSTPTNSKSLQTSLMARERFPYNSQSLHFQLLTSLHKLESM